MAETILTITDKSGDLDLFKKILSHKGFDIHGISVFDEIEEMVLKDAFAAVFVDYDLIGDSAYDLIKFLQKNRSRSCIILYGENNKAENISELLQIGAYGFVPRALLSERIYDTILSGLENRKAFIEILGMIDELRDVNGCLEKEKEALMRKNHEIDFINRLSSEVAYDLNWNKILPRIIDAGLIRVIDSEFIGIIYRIGPKWNLALYLSENKINKKTLEGLKKDLVSRFCDLSKIKISIKEMDFNLYPSKIKVSFSSPISFSKPATGRLLSVAGKPLGMLYILPENKEKLRNGLGELMSTISNILAMSLKNAQENQSLKEMAVTDGLTGIYNHKGFMDFMQREFQRARRYDKPLALIMIDVDDFKVINDSFGHQAGNFFLCELADCLMSSVRNNDIVTRYGGDEFAILLPETGKDKAEMLMKRILRNIKNHSFEWGTEKIEIEVSHGIFSINEIKKGKGEDEFIRGADLRLYNMKRSRNLL